MTIKKKKHPPKKKQETREAPLVPINNIPLSTRGIHKPHFYCWYRANRPTTLKVLWLASGILKGSRIIISTFKEPLIYLESDKKKRDNEQEYIC